MSRHTPQFALRLARSGPDVAAAQALRYRVFVEGMGAAGDRTDHALGLEADRHDRDCEHLLLIDALRDEVVGTSRIACEGPFATEAEFDITPLRRSGRRLMELGRTCLDPAHRGGAALHGLWQGVASMVAERRIDLLFGLASFSGTDPAAVAQPLGLLLRDHLAPPLLRPRSLDPVPLPALDPDRRAAVLAVPPLVKAYLRLGGKVGDGAFVDRAFNCIDLCLVLDAAAAGDVGRTGALGRL